MSIVLKETETILTQVLDVYENVSDCPLCLNAFGTLKSDGSGIRKVMSACAFQKGTKVAEERRKSCIVCDECVHADGDGTGHVLDKSGKCRVCVEVKKIDKKYACFANLPATHLESVTHMHVALLEAKQDNVQRLRVQDEEQQTLAAQAQRTAAQAAQDEMARKRGFKDRNEELAWREMRMKDAREDTAGATAVFTGETWDDFVAWERHEKELAEERRVAKEKLEEERRAEKEKLAEERRAEKERLEEERRAEKEKLAEERRAEKERLAEERRAEKEQLKEAQRRAEAVRRISDPSATPKRYRRQATDEEKKATEVKRRKTIESKKRKLEEHDAVVKENVALREEAKHLKDLLEESQKKLKALEDVGYEHATDKIAFAIAKKTAYSAIEIEAEEGAETEDEDDDEEEDGIVVD